MSELMPLPTIDLEISTPIPDQKVSLYTVITRKSTTNKEPVLYICKNKCSWCAIQRCAYVKA